VFFAFFTFVSWLSGWGQRGGARRGGGSELKMEE